jgi:hypothetical protein
MIGSAEKFIALRTSELKSEYDRAATEEAPIDVWREIIINHPNFRRWVSKNCAFMTVLSGNLSREKESYRRQCLKCSLETLVMLSGLR